MKALTTMKKVIFTSALLIFLFMTLGSAYGQVTPTNEWVRLWGEDCYLNGNPLPVGAVIDAYDPDGVNCGRFIVHTSGMYGFMSVYRDDIYTVADEGALPDDPITVYVNGIPATLNGPADPVWSKNGDPYHVEFRPDEPLKNGRQYLVNFKVDELLDSKGETEAQKDKSKSICLDGR